ncbi:MAG TPA: TolC family protein [Terracidiphilus sp.]|jgi:cobalt-zinc-cadmium efflux system outer membrane protein|nr:TolC family protein [Terracidiphilus sp.]
MKHRPHSRFAPGAGLLLLLAAASAAAQQPLTWQQVKTRFEAGNPALRADALSVDETRAEEITAYLRPNPQFTVTADGNQIAPNNGVWQPFAGTYVVPTLSYLHERDHKRELRLKDAQEATRIAEAGHADLTRNLEFTLRQAFVNTLQAKAVLELAKTDIADYDHIIAISRDRFKAGDIAQIDLDRIELLRVQYEVEIQTATVNLRTAKIQLQQLLDDRTPVEQFDVTGPFEFSDRLQTLDAVRQMALDTRPDLQAAMQTIQQAQTSHKLAIANGSTDPTFSGWYTYNSSNNNLNATQTLGASVNIPLRIFDRNQGEKQRTLIDIGRSQAASEAVRAQVFGDVDSSYAQVESSLALLKPYRDQYKDQATRVRDSITYSYEHGGASLIDFLNAQSDYRTVQLAYLQLIGSYLTAAAQLNLSVGREVIP